MESEKPSILSLFKAGALMTRSLHDEFASREKPRKKKTDAGSFDHPDAESILRRCKEILFTLSTGRRLINVLNLHHIPVKIETSPEAGYRVVNHVSIVLSCPPGPDVPLYELAIHLACAIRSVELHIQTYLSPETKDSRAWSNPQLAEPFELMLVVCQLAYDMNYFSKNPEVENFMAKNNYDKIYEAFENKNPYSQIESLMLESFNTRN